MVWYNMVWYVYVVSTYDFVEVRDGFRNCLDLDTPEVTETPGHGGVGNGLLELVVFRNRLRLGLG